MLYGYWDMQQDDSYIFYTYARNVADGNGYVFNIGEHVNATTSPLYTLLLAVCYKLFGSVFSLSLPVLGRLIGGVSLVLMCHFLMAGFRGRGEENFSCALPLVLLLNPLLTCAFGMELFLAMMLATACLAWYVNGNVRLAALAGSLAVLARPDMLIVPGLILVHHIAGRRRLPDLVSVTLFTVPVASWLVFSWFYFGSLLPATFSAKLAQADAQLWGSGTSFLSGFLAVSNWYGGELHPAQIRPLLALLVLLVSGTAAGGVVIIRKVRNWSILRHPAVMILPAWGLLHVVAYGIVLEAPAYPWYYTPLAPAFAVVMSLSLEALYRPGGHGSEISRRRWMLSSLIILIVVDLWLPLASVGNRTGDEVETHRQAAYWLNEHAPEGAVVGANDIDILRFYYEKGPVIDGLGLVTPGGAEHVRARDIDWFVRELQPDYLMLGRRSGLLTNMVRGEKWFNQLYQAKVDIGEEPGGVTIYERRP